MDPGGDVGVVSVQTDVEDAVEDADGRHDGDDLLGDLTELHVGLLFCRVSCRSHSSGLFVVPIAGLLDHDIEHRRGHKAVQTQQIGVGPVGAAVGGCDAAADEEDEERTAVVGHVVRGDAACSVFFVEVFSDDEVHQRSEAAHGETAEDHSQVVQLEGAVHNTIGEEDEGEDTHAAHDHHQQLGLIELHSDRTHGKGGDEAEQSRQGGQGLDGVIGHLRIAGHNVGDHVLRDHIHQDGRDIKIQRIRDHPLTFCHFLTHAKTSM